MYRLYTNLYKYLHVFTRIYNYIQVFTSIYKWKHQELVKICLYNQDEDEAIFSWFNGRGSMVVVLQIPEDIYKYLHFVQLWIMPG